MSEPLEELVDAPAEAEVAEEVALPLPGVALRAAREAHGYSLAEVSQALKFGVRQLEALENDDYAMLKGTTFIRGFVRSYARFLKIDETPLLAALEPQAPVAVSEVRSVETMGAEMPDSGSDDSKRAYWLAAIVLLLGVAAWFIWQEQAALKPIAGSIESATPVAPEVTQSAPGPTAEFAGHATKPAEPAPGAAVTAPSPTVISPGASAEPETTETAAAQPAPNPNDRQLVLSFGAVSWAEVRDASNRIIYSGNSAPNSRETVRGRPPFQLVVGNAQSVKLRYEDRNIDLQPYTRVDVARLTLDDNTK